MKRKIKLTDKDLEIRINNKSHYNQTCVFENESPQNDPTSVLACDATSVHVTCECATYPSNCFCNTTYCLTNNQTNTCTCNESRYCNTINCLETGNNCESIYHVCETYGNNCYDTGANCFAPESDNRDVISTECEETEVCAESYNCLYTEICVESGNVSCETKCMNY